MSESGAELAGPCPPSDNTTMLAVLEQYAQGGFHHSFEVDEDGPSLTCPVCGAESPVATVELHSLRRLEGASDPDDMVAIAAVSCPACGAKGTLVLGYGPSSTRVDAETLLALRDCRSEPGPPPSSAPGESTRS